MPRRVLHLLPNLYHSSALTQVALLGERLSQDDFQQHVAVLGSQGPGRAKLATAGLPVTELHQRFAWDPFARWQLKRLLRSQAFDVLQPWDAQSAAFARRVRRLVPQVLDPPSDLPPGVAPHLAGASQDRTDLGLPAVGKLIGVVGRLTPESHVDQLIWAMDLVRVVQPDVWLVLIGDGPLQAALQRFSQLACEENRTVWLGPRDDLPALLPHFSLLWHARQSPHAPLAMLEAMAAGVPVVASQSPGTLAALPPDQPIGLIPPGDRAARAKATLALLNDPTLYEQTSSTLQQHAQQNFSLQAWLESFQQRLGPPSA